MLKLKKRVVSLFVIAAMMVLAFAVPVQAAESVNVVVTANDTEVEVGDTVTFTVTATNVTDTAIQAMEFMLVIPDGMTLKSAKVVDGLNDKLGAFATDYTSETQKFTTFAGTKKLSGDTALLTFECTADKTGTYTVDLEKVIAKPSAAATACTITVSEKHVHTAVGDWQSDKTYHWKECSCGEDLDKATHTWNAGKVTTQPTEKAEGVKTYTCTVCKATKTEAIAKLNHTHDLKDGWKAEGGYHWQECNGCNEKVNYGKCEAGADGLCKVCGTKVVATDAGTTDDNKQETSPNTGDTATAALWFVVIAAAVVVIGGTRMRKSVR